MFFSLLSTAPHTAPQVIRTPLGLLADWVFRCQVLKTAKNQIAQLKIPWRRKWQPTPVFLPGQSHGQRSLAGYGPWGCKSRIQFSNEITTANTPGIHSRAIFCSCLKLFEERHGSLSLVTLVWLSLSRCQNVTFRI